MKESQLFKEVEMSYFEPSFYKPLKEILKKNDVDTKSNKKLNTKGRALSLLKYLFIDNRFFKTGNAVGYFICT